MTNPDEYLTVHNGKAPKPARPYLPNDRESFWLLMGCVAASGVSIGMSLQSIVYQIAEAIGG